MAKKRAAANLIRDFFLVFSREVYEVIVFCAYKERNSRLVEASTLSIPLFDRVERALSCEVEHEENGDCVVTH